MSASHFGGLKMTQSFALLAIGTAASSLLAILVLLRLRFNGQWPILTLARRWVTSDARTSSLVLAAVSAIAAVAFAAIPEAATGTATAHSAAASSQPDHTAFDADEDLAALQSYASSIDAPHEKVSGNAATGEALPGVDQMIAKLVARLKQQPDDVKGWKMLGWSYLNTGQTVDAARAYETALSLAPSDTEITAALAAVKSAQAENIQSPIVKN